LKNLLKKKSVVFKSGDKVAYSAIRKEVRAAIVKAKHNYKEKIEHKYLNADQMAVQTDGGINGLLRQSSQLVVFIVAF